MTTTIKTKSNDLLLLLFATVLLTAVSVQYLTAPHYLPISKIEDGTVIVRDDSITTVVIPDKR